MRTFLKMLPLRKLVWLGLAMLTFISLWLFLVPVRHFPAYAVPLTTPSAIPSTVMGEKQSAEDEPHFSSAWVTHHETLETHSASIAVVQGTAVTVWYGGTREGHKDVALYLATYDGGGWLAPKRIMTRSRAESGLGRYIRKLGNPALHAWPDGSLGVFFVTVSIGGWAGSSINYMETPDLGNIWSRPERLVTSPFLNISTLVRTQALDLQNGGISLPVYHEFIGKFAESLHLSRGRTVLDKVRISRGRHSLQPAIANFNESQAVAMLRYAGGEPHRLLTGKTTNAGRHWEKPEFTNLPNPDAAVALVNLGGDVLLMALNDLEEGRHRLSLAVHEKGQWRIVRVLEEATENQPEQGVEFSYPSFALDEKGFVHLVYTWNRKRIRHLKFNKTWLKQF